MFAFTRVLVPSPRAPLARDKHFAKSVNHFDHSDLSCSIPHANFRGAKRKSVICLSYLRNMPVRFASQSSLSTFALQSPDLPRARCALLVFLGHGYDALYAEHAILLNIITT